MNVMLSIKPKYCEKIKSGIKKYEFRKIIFKKKIDKVFIYSSSPVKKIIGTFKIDYIINDTPRQLWEICNGSSGLSKSEFFNYFNNTQRGYALKIDKTEFFEPFDPYKELQNFSAPQSFCYIKETHQNELSTYL